MGVIRVSANELKAKANDLTTLNASLKTNVNDLEATEQNLASMWEGEARDAFHQAFNNDKIQMTNFTTLIDKFVQSLLAIAAKYEQAENVNIATASTRNY
ncbi:MAG: WXG100 family type VII secretion target [Lachnospiraceae bacterium]|nr:WXG100 family type VII secretion target [Lachnospiraceae bacterium]